MQPSTTMARAGMHKNHVMSNVLLDDVRSPHPKPMPSLWPRVGVRGPHKLSSAWGLQNSFVDVENYGKMIFEGTVRLGNVVGWGYNGRGRCYCTM